MTDRPADVDALSATARDHLWMHFTRLSAYQDNPVPVITRGDGCYVWDSTGRLVALSRQLARVRG